MPFLSVTFGSFLSIIAGVFIFLISLKIKDNRQKKSIIQSIYVELNILWDIYYEADSSIGKYIEGRLEPTFKEIIIPSDMYFTIYKSNSGPIGKINNERLIELIVKVYLHIYEMTNSYKAYLNADSLLKQTKPASSQYDTLKKGIEDYMAKLKKSHNNLKNEWVELNEEIIKFKNYNKKS